MDNEIIKQTLIDSFEVLKDSWETKKDSIIRCIVETEVIDGNLAMDMWGYVIKKNESLLVDNSQNLHFIDDVVLQFNDKYHSSLTDYYIGETILKHIAPHLVKNENLIKIIFGTLCDAGYMEPNYPSDFQIIPAMIGCMFLQNCPHAVTTLIRSMANNERITNIRIGELILKANKYIDGIKNKWTWIKGDYNVSDKVKESLLDCIDIIKKNEDRAEIMLSLMAR